MSQHSSRRYEIWILEMTVHCSYTVRHIPIRPLEIHPKFHFHFSKELLEASMLMHRLLVTVIISAIGIWISYCESHLYPRLLRLSPLLGFVPLGLYHLRPLAPLPDSTFWFLNCCFCLCSLSQNHYYHSKIVRAFLLCLSVFDWPLFDSHCYYYLLLILWGRYHRSTLAVAY